MIIFLKGLILGWGIMFGLIIGFAVATCIVDQIENLVDWIRKRK